MKNLATIIQGTIVHILNITPKEEKRIEGLKRLTLASHGDPPVEYWNDLKSALRKRHIPSYYERELIDKLQRLRQGSMSFYEYRQKIELNRLRVGLREEERTSITRFFSGLNMEVKG